MRPSLQVTNVAHTFVDEWERVSGLLSELDVLLGFAELSVNAPTPYVRPTMLDTNAGELVLIGAHPGFDLTPVLHSRFRISSHVYMGKLMFSGQCRVHSVPVSCVNLLAYRRCRVCHLCSGMESICVFNVEEVIEMAS